MPRGRPLGRMAARRIHTPIAAEEPAQGGAGRPPQRGPALTQAAVHLTARGRAPLRNRHVASVTLRARRSHVVRPITARRPCHPQVVAP